MMRSTEMDALFAEFPVKVQERSSAGLFTQAGDSAIENARNDKEYWKLIIEKRNSVYQTTGYS
jgi:hypothetical protein